VKILGITQARIGSTRLPGKILMSISGKSLLSYHLEKAIKSKLVGKWIVATTNEVESERIVEIANQYNVASFKGDVENVLSRFYEASKHEMPDYIVRVTSDCPLLDPDLIDQIVEYTIKNDLNYCSTSIQYPDGLDVEIFKFSELEEAHSKATIKSDLEHVTPFIRQKELNNQPKNQYPCKGNFEHIRLTVDEIIDFDAIEVLLSQLGVGYSWIEYVNFINSNPKLFSNQSIIRNEGYLKSLQKDA